jgi:acyl-CoA dehydrogenase
VDPAKGRAGQRAFFVEQGTEGLGGFKIEKKMGLKSYESTSFTLDNVRVSAAHQLGAGGRTEKKAGFKAAMQTFNAGRPIIAAQAVGMARSVLDEAISFAKIHDLTKKDRVRDRIEGIARRVRKARMMSVRAAWLADQQRSNIIEASMSKALGAQIAQESASFALELLGTIGGAGNHIIEKLYRDVKAMDIVEGTGQIQKMLIARSLVGLPR